MTSPVAATPLETLFRPTIPGARASGTCRRPWSQAPAIRERVDGSNVWCDGLRLDSRLTKPTGHPGATGAGVHERSLFRLENDGLTA